MSEAGPAPVRSRAACGCGQLQVVCAGEPVRISMCHCLACQRRTGSIFGVQARFRRDQVVENVGQASTWSRQAASGNSVTFSFCPRCGSTVFWHLSAFPDLVAVAVGAFADPGFAAPRVSVFEATRHAWARTPEGPEFEHLD